MKTKETMEDQQHPVFTTSEAHAGAELCCSKHEDEIQPARCRKSKCRESEGHVRTNDCCRFREDFVGPTKDYLLPNYNIPAVTRTL